VVIWLSGNLAIAYIVSFAVGGWMWVENCKIVERNALRKQGMSVNVQNPALQ
jgi:hypothetical protein